MNSSMDSSLTMTDRLLMEPTFDLEDEEEGEGGKSLVRSGLKLCVAMSLFPNDK